LDFPEHILSPHHLMLNGSFALFVTSRPGTTAFSFFFFLRSFSFFPPLPPTPHLRPLVELDRCFSPPPKARQLKASFLPIRGRSPPHPYHRTPSFSCLRLIPFSSTDGIPYSVFFSPPQWRVEVGVPCPLMTFSVFLFDWNSPHDSSQTSLPFPHPPPPVLYFFSFL